MDTRQLFLRYNAQTSPEPLGLQVERAEGVYLYDANGKAYLDLIGGISVSQTGHGHPHVLKAIREQSEKYLHVMVYGEVIQSPQVRYAEALCKHLPSSLQSVYFTSSGSEATEGAMKLAKRVTGRAQILSCHEAYHGSTQGALSVMGSAYWQDAFRPLLPGIAQYPYGSEEMLQAISAETACVIVEALQAEAGVRVPDHAWLQALRRRTAETGTLLILDEIQTGFGRTGTLFRMEAAGITPDILLLGKALGGGLPLGAFIASPELMRTLTHDPVLGHITTFGGHPLSCAAGLAAFEVLLQHHLHSEVAEKEALFHRLLVHPLIRKLSSCGLLLAAHVEDYALNRRVIDRCLQKGLFTDWFLFAPHALRIAPPLTISMDEIEKACGIILESLDEEGAA